MPMTVSEIEAAIRASVAISFARRSVCSNCRAFSRAIVACDANAIARSASAFENWPSFRRVTVRRPMVLPRETSGMPIHERTNAKERSISLPTMWR